MPSDPNRYQPVAYRYANGIAAEMEMNGDGEYVLASDFDALHALAERMLEMAKEHAKEGCIACDNLRQEWEALYGQKVQ